MALPPPSNVPPPTSLPLPHPDAYEGEPREYARALMQRKDEIEAETDALNQVLASHGVNTTTSLLDPEGYPRADIDVYAIRHTRAALARLRTDHRTISDLLAPALEAAFAAPATSTTSSTASAAAKGLANGHAEGEARSSIAQMQRTDAPVHPQTANGAQDWPEGSVARVNSVAEGSPAESAEPVMLAADVKGLRAGDVISSFGDITHESGRGLAGIGALVLRSEGIAIPLRVQRGEARLELVLTPRNGWGGRGSLGCHILPP